MDGARIGHGALSVLPRAGQLVEARRRFDDHGATDSTKTAAAQVLIDLGNAFDQGRARAFLRDRARQLHASQLQRTSNV